MAGWRPGLARRLVDHPGVICLQALSTNYGES